MNLKATIGMENHDEIDTKLKIFCSCEVVETDEPNIIICPTSFCLPGALQLPNNTAL